MAGERTLTPYTLPPSGMTDEHAAFLRSLLIEARKMPPTEDDPVERIRELRGHPPQRDIGSVLQALYDSEINASLASFWDGGWSVKFGDHMNGYRAEANVDDLGQAAEWFVTEAKRCWPDSDFARAWK